ncbi:preprotein translocase subunit YajC [Fibrobacter sp. UWB1]|jgi:preprotein translocase subunit YajC|uniref:preprotein translocase subunit YajC n=1 Tax=unclassified Fibrobacter TaxID=2634177 RepID=UPI00091DEB39|nr:MULTISPECIES: preprotein translocase subunit YajC [unclassified Fibrobacter]OWV27472.1 preprotein translocase subunit YajC [Fibrobacter sp. UWB1]PWJ67366.1 protein translocase subunit yajC [Fibrobacter sp. UWB6]SHF65593.1 protein translocase subunit yajC [Fibrobacter sp. UWB8]SMG09888.1 protein translocase subunit yajC [Fibrobacter sp. UWB15]
MKLSALLVTLSSIAAFAEEAAPEQQPSAIGSFLPLILLFVVMWLFFIRPKNKEMKKMEEMRKALKKGDKVITTAGIIGTVTNIDETGTTVSVRTGSTTIIDFEKSAILRVLNAETAPAAKTEEKK